MDLNKIFIEKVLYPVMEKKKGNRTREYIEELKKTEALSEYEILELQKNKLKKLLLHCINNVPIYKDYKKYEDLIIEDSFAALRKFPILDKQFFKKNSKKFISDNIDESILIPNTTGGSTGEPVHFYMDRKTVEHYEAARWRGLSWWGITPGSRSIMIWGNQFEINKMQEKKYFIKEKYLKNRIMIPAYSLNENEIKKYVNIIDKYKPEYIYGYAGAIYVFSKLMLENNLHISHKLKAVVSTSENLHDYQREVISKALNTSVINEYGARDGGIIGYECPSHNMHISVENSYIEVADFKTKEILPEENSGLILVTDLNNYVMPRLRYELGDVITLSSMKCSCGREIPIIKSIDGREDDIFITIDNKYVHGVAFNNIIKRLDQVEKFQIVQYSKDYARLSIVSHNNLEPNGFTEAFKDIKNLLPDTRIDVEYVTDIPNSKSGKYRYAIRKFDI